MKTLLLWLTAAAALPAVTVLEVRTAAMAGDFATGEKLAAEMKAGGINGEYVEAYSWLGRGALAAKQYDKALAYAETTRQLSLGLLKSRPLDQEKHLPTAFGASIEVTGQAR